MAENDRRFCKNLKHTLHDRNIAMAQPSGSNGNDNFPLRGDGLINVNQDQWVMRIEKMPGLHCTTPGKPAVSSETREKSGRGPKGTLGMAKP
jgi:hypothetical protein